MRRSESAFSRRDDAVSSVLGVNHLLTTSHRLSRNHKTAEEPARKLRHRKYLRVTMVRRMCITYIVYENEGHPSFYFENYSRERRNYRERISLSMITAYHLSSLFFSLFFSFLYRISFRDHVFCPGVPSVSMKSIHTRWLITIKTIYIIVIISLLKHLNEICKNISSKSIFVFFFSLHFTKIIDKLNVIHGYLFDFFCNIKICVRSIFFFTNIDIDKYDCIMF